MVFVFRRSPEFKFYSRCGLDSPVLDLTWNPDSSQMLTGIADEINDAMGTSYIHGRWVTAMQSRSLAMAQIITNLLAAVKMQNEMSRS